MSGGVRTFWQIGCSVGAGSEPLRSWITIVSRHNQIIEPDFTLTGMTVVTVLEWVVKRVSI